MTPKYMNITINNNYWQCINTTRAAQQPTRKNQELKFLYLKKQKINKCLYHYNLECANQWLFTWNYIQTNIRSLVCRETYFNIQSIHKKMVWFQKLTRNLFLTLHRHNVHCQQQHLSEFLMCYQQFTSHAYCGAPWPRSKHEKGWIWLPC